MTRADYLATISALGMSARSLARVLRRPEGSVGNWSKPGYGVPPDVAEWLQRRLACMRADPPPR